MDYKVVVTSDAEENLEHFIKYLIIEKESIQAAQNMLNDYDATIESLKHVAGSLKLCDNLRLRQLEYRRINFLNHRYFMLTAMLQPLMQHKSAQKMPHFRHFQA